MSSAHNCVLPICWCEKLHNQIYRNPF